MLNVYHIYLQKKKFDEGNIFILSFNFVTNKLIIYDDGVKADTLDLIDCNCIMPAFTLDQKNTEIEIIKYEFKFSK